MRLSGFNGFHQGALQAAPTSLRVPHDDVSGFAWVLVVNVPIDEHALLASADFGIIGVPSYIECSGEDCRIASDEQSDTSCTPWPAPGTRTACSTRCGRS